MDDYVDCGDRASLKPSRAVIVEAWLCPAEIPGAGEAGAVGKCYDRWTSPHKPSRPVAQEITVNFVQVKPYVELSQLDTPYCRHKA